MRPLAKDIEEAYAVSHCEHHLVVGKDALWRAREIAVTQEWHHLREVLGVCIDHCGELIESLEEGKGS